MILTELPTEVLWQIVSHIRFAGDILHLSMTCQKLQDVVSNDGFRIFTQNTFPSISIPLPVDFAGKTNDFYRSAARSLTTLTRGWDRKAVLAHQMLPLSNTKASRFGVRTPQTMGFIPYMDCHDEWFGGVWYDRKKVGNWYDRQEVIVCSTGAQFEFRINDLSKSEDDNCALHKYSRVSYDDKEALDGRDDIVFVKLLKPTNSTQGVLIGRSSGNFERLSRSNKTWKWSKAAVFETGGKAIKVAATSVDGLLAACLADRLIALYDVGAEGSTIVLPKQELQLPLPDTVQARATCFLRQDRLAVAYGSSLAPMQVFDIADGRLKEANPIEGTLRNCTLRRGSFAKIEGESAFSIAPVSPRSAAGGQGGNLFLAGYSEGSIALHDLRCRGSVVSEFKDNVDTSAVYSLMAYGQERFVAGAGRGSLLKMFDLRLGAKKYYANELLPCSQPIMQNESSGSCCYFHHQVSRDRLGWNLFLRDGRGRYDSPVYSLSKTSDFSPTFYAGIEGNVLEVNIHSMMDKFPEPVLRFPRPTKGESFLSQSDMLTWAKKRGVLRLRMYEHVRRTNEAAKLRKQSHVGIHFGVFSGWDERWEPL